jgi:hypothetical protein
MSISKLFMLGPVVTAAGQINQIQSYNFDPGVETVKHMSDGGVDPNLIGVMQQSPKLQFVTTAIKRALDIAGISGYSVAAAADLYFQKIAQGGTRTGSTTSLKLTGTKGILCPLSLSCQDKSYAQLSMALAFQSTDGTTAPLAADSAATMATPTAADQLYTLGPIKLNGTEVEGIKDVNIDFGIDLIVEHGSGEAYPTFIGIKTRAPSITFKCTDPTLLSTSGAYYVAQGATDSLVYLRKMASNGTRVADATASHIQASIDDGIIHVRQIDGGTEDVQMSEVTIEPTFDGTNTIIAITTAIAIT